MSDTQRREPMNGNSGALRALGLCRAAGKAVCGTDLVCRALHRVGTVFCVVLASDASENTVKRLNDKCSYYGVSLYKMSASMAELASAVGKRGSQTAAIAITDANLARLFMEKLGADAPGQK